MFLYWENLGSSIKKHKKRVFTKQLKVTPSVQSEDKCSTKNSDKSFDLSDPSDTESDMKTVALELKDFITEEKNDVESFYKKFGKNTQNFQELQNISWFAQQKVFPVKDYFHIVSFKLAHI